MIIYWFLVFSCQWAKIEMKLFVNLFCQRRFQIKKNTVNLIHSYKCIQNVSKIFKSYGLKTLETNNLVKNFNFGSDSEICKHYWVRKSFCSANQSWLKMNIFEFFLIHEMPTFKYLNKRIYNSSTSVKISATTEIYFAKSL